MALLNSAFTEHGLFSDLIKLLHIEQLSCFPNVAQLNAWAARVCERTNSALYNSKQNTDVDFSTLNLSFVEQHDDFDWQGQYYEQVIFDRNIIPTRANNWHDFFNACIWMLFPQTKQILNRQHIADINEFGLQQRSKRRNALTLFDECGVIITHIDSTQAIQLQNHQWSKSFIEQRDCWFKTIKPFMFGHANYEMALNPFDGLTGKALFVEVNTDFYQYSLIEQYQYLDRYIAQQLVSTNLLQNNKVLSPMPFLGIPSWYGKNELQHYYNNVDYFRPKRIAKPN